MAFFERNKVIEEQLETDSGSVEFLVNRGRRETDRKGKENISYTIFLSCFPQPPTSPHPLSSKAL